MEWHFACKENKKAVMDMITEILKDFSSNGKEMCKEDMKKYYKDLVGEASLNENEPDEL